MNLMPLPWERLRGKRILLAGATGLIGTFLVDTLFSINRIRQLGMTVYAVGRDEDTARQRFDDIWEDPRFSFYPWDVTQPASFPEPVDFVIHAACDTQPTRILEHPVETMMSNIYGTENLLEVAHDCGAKRFLFLSSGSIYGEPWRADDCVNESYYGSLSCNTVRAAYAESKRAGETLCKSWRSQYGLDVVIARLAHVYGPTMRQDDTKPLSQMILDCAKQQNIVLHEDGDRHVSCCYVADAVMGILYVLLTGKNGSAYNIAGSSGKLRTLKDIAEFLADYAGTKAIYDMTKRSMCRRRRRASTVCSIRTRSSIRTSCRAWAGSGGPSWPPGSSGRSARCRRAASSWRRAMRMCATRRWRRRKRRRRPCASVTRRCGGITAASKGFCAGCAERCRGLIAINRGDARVWGRLCARP